jgi:hypothetical protein
VSLFRDLFESLDKALYSPSENKPTPQWGVLLMDLIAKAIMVGIIILGLYLVFKDDLARIFGGG